MRRDQNGFVPVEIMLILVVIAIGLIGLLVFRHGQVPQTQSSSSSQAVSERLEQPQPKQSKEVSAQAEALIIARVGQDEFKNHFKIDAKFVPEDDEYGGQRAYHYDRLKSVTDDDLIVVHVNLKDPSGTYENLVPNCVKDASLCNFKIGSKQAIAVAKQHSFNTSDLKTRWYPAYKYVNTIPLMAIEVDSCSLNKAMYIDYRTGAVLGFESKIICSPPTDYPIGQ